MHCAAPADFVIYGSPFRSMISTQHTLVARLKERASASDWERFYRLYEKPILAIATSKNLSEADCRDVLQETMVKMFRFGFARYDRDRGRFTPFLFGIAKDCSIDALRRNIRKLQRERIREPGEVDPLRHDHLEPIADPNLRPDSMAAVHGQQVLILTALEFLVARGMFAQKTADIFKALAFDSKSPVEVAKSYNTSRGNVDQAKSAILKKLRPMYEALDQGMDLEQAYTHTIGRLNL
jgi:RNA polymerase sigma factor (sigma-70 family)